MAHCARCNTIRAKLRLICALAFLPFPSFAQISHTPFFKGRGERERQTGTLEHKHNRTRETAHACRGTAVWTNETHGTYFSLRSQSMHAAPDSRDTRAGERTRQLREFAGERATSCGVAATAYMPSCTTGGHCRAKRLGLLPVCACCVHTPLVYIVLQPAESP